MIFNVIEVNNRLKRKILVSNKSKRYREQANVKKRKRIEF